MLGLWLVKLKIIIMEEMNTVIIVISAVIGLVVLICFFYLCEALNKVKNYLVKEKRSYEYNLNLYYKYLSYGDKETAKKYLQDLVWDKLEIYRLQTTSDKSYEEDGVGEDGDMNREKMYNTLKDKYEKLFKNVDATFPERMSSEKRL